MDTQLRAAHMPWTALAPVSCMAGAPSRIPTHVSGGGSIPQCRCSGATWAKNRQLYGSPFLLLTSAGLPLASPTTKEQLVTAAGTALNRFVAFKNTLLYAALFCSTFSKVRIGNWCHSEDTPPAARPGDVAATLQLQLVL